MPRLAIPHGPADYDESFVDVMVSQYFEPTAWSRLRLASIAELVQPQAGERLLDLGCAIGAQADFFSRFGCETVGVDLEPKLVAKARQLFPDIEFHVADAVDLPFPDGSFEKVVAADLTEHVLDDTLDAMFAEVHRVLAPGGAVAIYTPNPGHVIERLKERNVLIEQNPLHIGLRDRHRLAAALGRAGLAVEHDGWAPSPWLKPLERLGSRWFELFRYRICLRARKPAGAELAAAA